MSTLEPDVRADRERAAHKEFLAALSSIRPQDQRYWVNGLHSEVPQDPFGELLGDNKHVDLDSWLHGREQSSLLWIQDETNEGHTLFVSAITEALEAASRRFRFQEYDYRPLVSYFFCRPYMGETRSAAQVLRGLIYRLLVNSPSALSHVITTCDMNIENLRGELHELPCLSNILQVALQSQIFEKCRIFLVVEGIDQCASDANEVGISDLLETMSKIAKTGIKFKFIVSSKPSRDIKGELARLHFGHQVLRLDPAQVATALHMDEMIETIKSDAKVLQTSFNLLRPGFEQDAPVSWFEYCKAGRAWLQKPTEEVTTARTIWYQRSDDSRKPSGLALRAVDLVSRYEGAQPAVVYFSFSSLLKHDAATSTMASNSQLQPAVALWASFCQLAGHGCTSPASWVELLAGFPKTLRRPLRKICSEASEQQRLPNSHATAAEQFKGYAFLDGAYLPILVKLVAAALEKISQDVLILLDCLELSQPEKWKDVLSSVQKSLHTRTRILCCANSRFLRDYSTHAKSSKVETVSVNEHTEYSGMLAASRDRISVHAYSPCRMSAKSSLQLYPYSPRTNY